MHSQAITLDGFIAEYPFWGEWEVSYTDQTHLPEGKYVSLGCFTVDGNESMAHDFPVLPFTFKPVSNKQIEDTFAGLPDGQEQARRARRIILGQLADSMVRTGLMRPTLRLLTENTIEPNHQQVLVHLSQHRYLIFVVDTGAMRRGIVSFLHTVLPELSIWTVVPVFVMTEVQRQVADLNDIWRKQEKPHPGKCDVLEKRPQVSCISRELNYIRQWRPVELLSASPEFPRQANATVDRLIIESLKNLKRERGIHREVYLLTGDKDVASLAMLENVNSLHAGVPSLPGTVNSIRYDSRNRRFILTPVHYLLWDLVQIFSTLRVENPSLDQQYELSYYCKARDGFIAHDIMEIHEN